MIFSKRNFKLFLGIFVWLGLFGLKIFLHVCCDVPFIFKDFVFYGSIGMATAFMCIIIMDVIDIKFELKQLNRNIRDINWRISKIHSEWMASQSNKKDLPK